MKKVHVAVLFVLYVTILLTCTSYASQCDVTVTPLSFGNYDPLSSTPTTTSCSVNISCKTPDKFPQVVTLSLSAGGSGNPVQRTLTNQSGVGSLLYYVYNSPAGGQVIGDGTGGTSTLTQNVSRNRPWQLSLYGEIPALQNVPVGLYSDTLTATILW